MSTINLEKIVYDKDSYGKVIDNSFNQLTIPDVKEENIPLSIDDFFELYENIFITIPKEGEIKSHQYILNKTAEYLGVSFTEEVDIQALLDEITTLRNELLENQELVAELTKK